MAEVAKASDGTIEVTLEPATEQAKPEETPQPDK